MRVIHRHTDSPRDWRQRRGSCSSYEQEHSRDYGRKRGRYEGSGKMPVRSDWDDGRWEWEGTPRRDGHSYPGQQTQPSTPLLVGASPDARLVSPWLGGHTHSSAGSSQSPWDHIAPSPTPIRASGSGSRHGRKSHQLTFSSASAQPLEEKGEDQTFASEEHNNEITENMRLEMAYNSDRAWYDREEGSTMFDTDSSFFFFRDEDSLQKKEAELAKRLVRRDGSKMSLAQSKRLSQLTADNAQWEDRQLLRSGAVRGTEVQTEFDDEEERKIQNLLSLMEELYSPNKQSLSCP